MTYYIVVLLLTESETEVGVLVIGLFELRLEDNHHPILQEVVEQGRIGMKALTLKIVNPKSKLVSRGTELHG